MRTGSAPDAVRRRWRPRIAWTRPSATLLLVPLALSLLLAVLASPHAPTAIPFAAVLTALGVAALAILGGRGIGLAAAGTGRRQRLQSTGAVRARAATDVSLPSVLDAADDAIALLDARGVVGYANPVFTRLFGEVGGRTLASDDVLGRRIDEPETFAAHLRALAAEPEERGQGELTYFGEQVRIFTWTSAPLRDPRGAPAGRLLVLRDRSHERELAALKSDFLSTVTHELRTPLTSVKGSLQLVLGKSSGLSAIDRELLHISLKNTDRLIRLINDLLDISRLELGKIELAFTTLAPTPLMEEAVAGLRAYAAGRDIAIACEVEPDLPTIEGDHDRLMQVLTNLISNAVKFSPAGGRVVVRGSRCGGDVAIAVRDWGIGIQASDQGRLFQRFQRINPSSSVEPGTGLGLAISRAIAERHGGRITLESREEEGSTFTVLLPAAKMSGTGLAVATHEATPVRATARPTVLVIDDDVDLGTVLEVSLGDGYRVLRVERGVQALDVARVERPDLILLDVVLPDISGYDVLRILQHSGATRALPVIMLTVQPERELAWGLGAVDVVAKPVDIEVLRGSIVRALARRADGAGLRIVLGPLRQRPSDLLIEAFAERGHEVFVTGDLFGLLRCADERHPDVVVLDVDPPADKAVAFVRGHASTRAVPLVLLSEEDLVPAVTGCTRLAAALDDAAVVQAVERVARPRLAS